MNIQEEMKVFKDRVDREMEIYFDRVITEATKKDVFITDALRYVKQFSLSGGKRLRAAFMYYGYRAAGGTDMDRMIRTTVSVELVHIFLLIHDDIIDRDEKRHGVTTIHKHFQKIGSHLSVRSDAAHFGNSMAIIVGDMIGALGNQIIFESGFDPVRVLSALSKLQDIVSLTVVGEAQDIMIEYRGYATEAEILAMYENKTARYTIDGPIQLGCILAGGSEELSRSLSAYAVPLGIAFQIQDDILGVFGSEDKLGKPVGSDIEEGKITILVSKALSRISKREQKELLAILKKGPKLSTEDIDRFRFILKDSGALQASRDLAHEYIETGKQALLPLSFESEAKEFLLGVAEYMEKRER